MYIEKSTIILLVTIELFLEVLFSHPKDLKYHPVLISNMILIYHFLVLIYFCKYDMNINEKSLKLTNILNTCLLLLAYQLQLPVVSDYHYLFLAAA